MSSRRAIPLFLAAVTACSGLVGGLFAAEAEGKTRAWRSSRARRARPARFRRRPRGKRRVRRRPRRRSLRLPAMPLYHIHHKQQVWIRPYDHRGHFRRRALHRFWRFMRCHHTERVKPIHQRVLVVLYETWLRFGQPQVTVFSGYRPQVVARLKTSNHIKGRAIDFQLNGIDNRRVRDFLLRTFRNVGVGYYPNSYHVHLDVRSRKSFWIDYAGPSQRPIYASRPYRDVKRGLAQPGYKPLQNGKGTLGAKRRRLPPRPRRLKVPPRRRRPAKRRSRAVALRR